MPLILEVQSSSSLTFIKPARQAGRQVTHVTYIFLRYQLLLVGGAAGTEIHAIKRFRCNIFTLSMFLNEAVFFFKDDFFSVHGRIYKEKDFLPSQKSLTQMLNKFSTG